eukprot:tig00021094_g18115.t1
MRTRFALAVAILQARRPEFRAPGALARLRVFLAQSELRDAQAQLCAELSESQRPSKQQRISYAHDTPRPQAAEFVPAAKVEGKSSSASASGMEADRDAEAAALREVLQRAARILRQMREAVEEGSCSRLARGLDAFLDLLRDVQLQASQSGPPPLQWRASKNSDGRAHAPVDVEALSEEIAEFSRWLFDRVLSAPAPFCEGLDLRAQWCQAARALAAEPAAREAVLSAASEALLRLARRLALFAPVAGPPPAPSRPGPAPGSSAVPPTLSELERARLLFSLLEGAVHPSSPGEAWTRDAAELGRLCSRPDVGARSPGFAACAGRLRDLAPRPPDSLVSSDEV